MKFTVSLSYTTAVSCMVVLPNAPQDSTQGPEL